MAILFYLIQDPLFLISVQYSGAVVVIAAGGGEGAGNNVDVLILLDFPVFDGEGLLKYHGVLILRVGIASETEIPQAVSDVFVLITLDALQNMGVMSDYQICPLINGEMCQVLLNICGSIFSLIPPMEIDDDEFRAGFFQCGDILLHLLLLLKMVGKLVDAG